MVKKGPELQSMPSQIINITWTSLNQKSKIKNQNAKSKVKIQSPLSLIYCQ